MSSAPAHGCAELLQATLPPQVLCSGCVHTPPPRGMLGSVPRRLCLQPRLPKICYTDQQSLQLFSSPMSSHACSLALSYASLLFLVICCFKEFSSFRQPSMHTSLVISFWLLAKKAARLLPPAQLRQMRLGAQLARLRL